MRRRRRSVSLEDQLLAQADQIETLDIVLHVVPQVVVSVAGAAERVFAAFHLDHGDLAAPVAFFLAAARR